jgi:hypothetical protein
VARWVFLTTPFDTNWLFLATKPPFSHL